MHKTYDNSHLTISSLCAPSNYRDFTKLSGIQRFIGQGSCLSYSPCSFAENSLTINSKRFNRFIEFDSKNNTLSVESGAQIKDIFKWRQANGYVFDILPGHPNITIGDCIAADVHGKNPLKDGTFSSIVEEIILIHPKKGELLLKKREQTLVYLD